MAPSSSGPPSPTGGPVSASFTYSAEGARASTTLNTGAGQAYTYDAESRLTSVTDRQTAAVVTYAYDGDGLRRSKDLTGGQHITYTYDQQASLPLLIDDGTTSYLYGPGGVPVEQIADGDGTASFLLPDTRGSIRIVTDLVGNVIGTATFGVTGVELAQQGVTSPFGFDGQYTDAETGFQYLRARYYDPVTSSFLTPDPLVDLTGTPYGFAGGDPVSFADPSGLFFISCATLFSKGSDLVGGAGDLSDGVERRASVLGRLLRTSDDPAARSYAARLLRGAGQLSRNPVFEGIRGLGWGVPVVGGALTTFGDLSEGKGYGESIGAGAGSTAGGIAGGTLGGLACASETVATLGFGSVACPVLVVGLGYAGGKIGEFVGGKVGGWVGDLF